jgi:hypothetical protein
MQTRCGMEEVPSTQFGRDAVLTAKEK